MAKGKGLFNNKQNISFMAILFSISLLQMSGMNISPALQTIALRYPEVSSESIQTLVTLPSMFMVIASFFAEPVSKLISRKRTILVGSAFFCISGLLPTFFDSFTILKLSRMLIGLGTGIMMPISSTLLFSFFTDPIQRNSVIGWQSCSSATGNIIATNLAGFLVAINYKLTFLVHLVGLITFFTNLILLPQDEVKRKEEKKEKTKIKLHITKGTVFWLVFVFVYMSYLNCFSTKISLLVESSGIGSSSVSALGISMLTVGSFLGGLSYGFISKILKKWTIVVALFVSALGIFSLGVATTPFPVYLSGFCTGLGLSMESPVVVVGLLGKAEPDERIRLSAFSSACSNLGLSFSPYITSYTTRLFFGPAKTLRNEYLVCSIVLAVMGVFALVNSFCLKRKNIQ